MFEQIALFIEDGIATIGYPGLSLVLFLEAFVPPLPAQWVIPFTGVLVARGDYSFVGALLAGVVGEVGGALGVYWLGRVVGEKRLKKLIHRFNRWVPISDTEIDGARYRLKQRGWVWILLVRLVPAPPIRSLVAVTAGLTGINALSFTLLTLPGSLISVGALMMVGVKLGENWRSVIINFMEHPLLWVILGSIGVATLFINRWLVRRRLRLTQPTAQTHLPDYDASAAK